MSSQKEASQKELLAQASAVGLYDQMALIGIAPPMLVPLRKHLPALVAVAYSGDKNKLSKALLDVGVMHLGEVERCAVAIMELVGTSQGEQDHGEECVMANETSLLNAGQGAMDGVLV